MNLQLIDPFRRHIPDRIDSTLTVPRALHPLMPSSDAGGIDDNDEDEANQIKRKKRSDTEGDDDVIQSKSTEGEDEGDENTKNQDKGKDTTVEETKPKRRKKDNGKHEEDDEEDQYWTACYTVSFDRRGTALASAHASGLVPIHDFLSRTTSALYWPPPPISLGESETCASLGIENGLQFSGTFFERGQKRKVSKSHEEGRVDGASNEQLTYVNGVTSLSWDRHNKTILAGAIGDYNLRLMDNTHPQVSLDCAEAAKREHNGSAISTVEDKSVPSLSLESQPVYASFQKSEGEAVVGLQLQTSSWGRGRLLRGNVLSSSHSHQNQCASSSAVLSSSPPTPECSITTTVPCMRHPTLILELPQPLGGPAQLHPHDSSTGLACLHDGSLVLFRLPLIAFHEILPKASPGGGDIDSTNDTLEMLKREESKRSGNIDPPRSEDDGASSYFITCAAFGQSGTEIYAATKCGTLLAFRIPTSMIKMLRDEHNADLAMNLVSQKIKPSVCVKVPGAAAAWQIIVSRNEKHVLINSADCALRLYDVEEIFKNESATEPIHVSPRFVFQDTLSRSPWASCDFSADNEYVVGGCSSYSQSGNYNLFIWNAVTGELVDQLKGPQASLYSLSCHPTRSFIAVGTSDGVIDIWGPRVQWTAFAPDFQARQANVLYEEKEDEFDIVVDSNEGNVASESKGPPEEGIVDIINVEKTAAMGSDSEDENEVFKEVRVLKIFSEKSKPKSEMCDLIK